MLEIYCESKFYKLKLLEKLVVQHGIKTSFGGGSCIQTPLPYIYIPNLLSLKEVDCGCLPTSLCLFMCGMRSHMREGVRVHDIQCKFV